MSAAVVTPPACSIARAARLRLADEAVRRVLRLQYEGEPALIVRAPPGAGKSWLVLATAATSAGILGERCLVATQTNAQAFELVERFAGLYARPTVTLYCRAGLALPDHPAFRSRSDLPVRVVREPSALPHGPCIIVANAQKLAQSALANGAFDLLVVDEADQLPNVQFLAIAGLARRVALIGDPGQIPPVVTSDITRWRDDPAGPQVPAPSALLATHPDVTTIRLPLSRRLVQDTVGLVQPAFYGELPFRALDRFPDRRLEFRAARAAGSRRERALDQAIHLLEGGASVLGLELPSAPLAVADAGIAAAIVRAVERLLGRGAVISDENGARRLEARHLGVVCAHRVQVRAVRELLPPAIAPHVLVETANRYQGLEREVVLVWHPLSGRLRTRDFHVDAGRFCVMLSRHRLACLLFWRAGTAAAIARHIPEEPPPLGAERDAEYEGWLAHRSILERLVSAGRVVRCSA